MKKIITAIAIIFSITLYSQNKFSAKWDNGFKVQSENKNLVLKFGGRIYYDVAFVFQDSARADKFGKLKNGHEFRSARLYHSGTIYKNLKYKFNLDFAGGKITFKDVYVQYSKIPYIGNIRIGHYFTPVGLEANTSSKYISFMEGAMMNHFTPSRNTGIMIFNSYLNKRLNAQIGAFRYTDKFGNDKFANEGIRLQAKVSSAIINNKEKQMILHLGASYEYSHSKDSIIKLGVTPEAHLAHKNIKGKITGNQHNDLVNVEAAFIKGPFSIQSEFSLLSSHQYNTTNYISYGYYAYAGYIITGETRAYKGMHGFGRIKPKKNVGKGGFGAFELLLRYSRLDAREGFYAGYMDNVTLGLNWYLNPSARIMLNVVHTTFNNDGIAKPMNAHIFQTRFQVDF